MYECSHTLARVSLARRCVRQGRQLRGGPPQTQTQTHPPAPKGSRARVGGWQEGDTALNVAAQDGRLEVMKRLIVAKASVDAANEVRPYARNADFARPGAFKIS